MFFDNNGALIDSAKTFNGSIDDVSFTYRDLVNEALSVNAFKVVIAHNHPSKNPLPSPDDIQSTKHLISSLKQVNIELIDSYIVTNNSCVGVMEFTLDKVKKSF
jgi:DNA repair protein RadC